MAALSRVIKQKKSRHPGDDPNGDEKYMLHGPGHTLNRYVKQNDLDNIFIYKT